MFIKTDILSENGVQILGQMLDMCDVEELKAFSHMMILYHPEGLVIETPPQEGKRIPTIHFQKTQWPEEIEDSDILKVFRRYIDTANKVVFFTHQNILDKDTVSEYLDNVIQNIKQYGAIEDIEFLIWHNVLNVRMPKTMYEKHRLITVTLFFNPADDIPATEFTKMTECADMGDRRVCFMPLDIPPGDFKNGKMANDLRGEILRRVVKDKGHRLCLII